uniref:Dinoflagellate viral nucleoprotein DVNP.9 n=1 Tax=Hematodinium sp. SG-2012 TaxID=1263730 RepID=K9NUG3_9DINO|nr:dinoflagellate viral nucleoprotein DVNP.9 [Hematodinium sp. SG-2012]
MVMEPTEKSAKSAMKVTKATKKSATKVAPTGKSAMKVAQATEKSTMKVTEATEKSAMKVTKTTKKSAMKVPKVMKSGKKVGMKKKAKRVSKIARGKSAKLRVFRGKKEKTSGGLTKNLLVKNRLGKVVSKKQLEHGKKIYNKGAKKWIDAVMKARKALNIKGFQSVGGETVGGKALLARARQLYKN